MSACADARGGRGCSAAWGLELRFAAGSGAGALGAEAASGSAASSFESRWARGAWLTEREKTVFWERVAER